MGYIPYVILGVSFLGLGLLLGYNIGKKKGKKVENNSDINDLFTDILEEGFKNSSVTQASQTLISKLKFYYGIDYVTLFLLDERTSRLNVVATGVDTAYIKNLETYTNTLVGNIKDCSARVNTSSDGTTLTYAQGRGVVYSLFCPLSYKNKLIGALLLENKSKDVDNEKVRFELYDKILTNTSLVLQSVVQNERLLAMISTDQLTGVYNRRYIDVTLREQLDLHASLNMEFSVVMLDIDYFKRFNDTYGHQFGDLVLQEMSNYIKGQLDGDAWIGRYGGEEFTLFFGRSKANDVMKKVESIRKGVESLKLTDGVTTTSVTASFGVATYGVHAKSVQGLLEAADKALYKSKENGRNKVTYAEKGGKV